MTADVYSVNYPKEIRPQVDVEEYTSVVEVFNEFCGKYADRPAFHCLGHSITYAELDRRSAEFGAFLQNETDLQPGDRIAIQLPNILQYPIALFGAIRAGFIVVNTNPLYTPREMEHQFNDSGAKALIVYAAMANQAEQVIPNTGIRHVIVTEVADMHPPVKRWLTNAVVKHVKKMVPDYHLPQALSFRAALAKGARHQLRQAQPTREDTLVLQYTGGTTGVAKGAELTHGNLIANMQQSLEMFRVAIDEGEEVAVAPLPLYHIYAFTVHCMVLSKIGTLNILIPNPRDLPGFIKAIKPFDLTVFVGLNTLFVALCNNEEFKQLRFNKLKLVISGGMALTRAAAELWQKTTGHSIAEGYGMTEASPVVSFNPPKNIKLGSIGIPVPNTEVQVTDEEGKPLAQGEAGELCVRGPQVMKGYWNRPEATAKTITEDGWLKTGDIAAIDDEGYIKIVDRKKDMIIVSGFNVYPNEIEDVMAAHPEVVECAAVGVPDVKSGEAVKLFVVLKSQGTTKEELVSYARDNLTAYKVPRHIEFREELPKTNVGKILRRELRDANPPEASATKAGETDTTTAA